MPLGDSITQADNEHDSYRRLLWQNLRSSGFNIDFVGSERSHHGGNAPNDDFDWDHEGHWGWRADEILERIGEWATRYPADIVLIHLGTNDVLERQNVDETIEELGRIIDELRSVNPRVAVLLAQIIPIADSRNTVVRTLNERIDQLGKGKNRDDAPVIVVDQYTDFDPATDTYDGLHPGFSGEKKMAERWFGALEELLPSPR
jgi:lysophospholipase L1-like esterase